MNEGWRKLLDTVQKSSYIATLADPNKTIIGIEYYAYSVDNWAAQGGVTMQSLDGGHDFPIVMDSDSDFVVCSMTGGGVISSPVIGTPANGNRVVEFSPSVLVQITDESSGKTYFSAPTPLPMTAGAAGFPYLLINPRIVRPRSTLNINASIVAESSVGAPLVMPGFFFTLHGAKIYYAS